MEQLPSDFQHQIVKLFLTNIIFIGVCMGANRRIVSWLSVAVLLLNIHATAAEPDYMTGELRERVEALKAAYRSEATTPDTYLERAAVAWEWVNAYARTGKSVPVNITTGIRPVLPYAPARRSRCGSTIAWVKKPLNLAAASLSLVTSNPATGPTRCRILRGCISTGALAATPPGGWERISAPWPAVPGGSGVGVCVAEGLLVGGLEDPAHVSAMGLVLDAFAGKYRQVGVQAQAADERLVAEGPAPVREFSCAMSQERREVVPAAEYETARCIECVS